MGLGHRQARQHDTGGIRRSAVDSSVYADFAEKEAVMTVDGYPGRVVAVHDGPVPGTESYDVILDGGLGGGQYTASQLRKLEGTTASHEHEAVGAHMASDDYEELRDILHERPPIERVEHYASKGRGNPFAVEAAEDLDEHQQRALHRLKDVPTDERGFIRGHELHKLLSEHNIVLHKESPHHYDYYGSPEDDSTNWVDQGDELHTGQQHVRKPTLEHFIRHPYYYDEDDLDTENGEDERPQTYFHQNKLWIGEGHHRLLADRMTHGLGMNTAYNDLDDQHERGYADDIDYGLGHTHAAAEPPTGEPLAQELPSACSYCGSANLQVSGDNGRNVQATCSDCRGTMSSWGGQFTPELIGDPSNHPRGDADPRSQTNGGVPVRRMNPADASDTFTASLHDAARVRREDGWSYEKSNGLFNPIVATGPDGQTDKYFGNGLTGVRHPEHMPTPLYHGTGREIPEGAQIEPGHPGNFVKRMKHVYMVEDANVARQYAGPDGHVYEVQPTDFYGHRSDAKGVNWASEGPLNIVRKVPHAEAPGYDSVTGELRSTSAKYRYQSTVQGPEGYEDQEREIEGPLYHGGRAKVGPGDHLTPGRKTNSWGDEGTKSTHVYFTTSPDTALSYAQQLGHKGRLYEVEPTGHFKKDYGPEDYKTQHPLRVVREVPREEWPEWARGKTSSLHTASEPTEIDVPGAKALMHEDYAHYQETGGNDRTEDPAHQYPEIGQHLRSRGIHADFGGIDANTARLHDAALSHLHNLYPGVLTHVDTAKDIPQGDEFAHSSGSSITFSERAMKRRGQLEMHGRVNHISGHTAASGAIGIAAHEFGHAFEHHVGMGNIGISQLAAELHPRVGSGRAVQLASKKISEYAHKGGPHELVAEAFSDRALNGSNAAPLSHAIFNKMHELYHEKHSREASLRTASDGDHRLQHQAPTPESGGVPWHEHFGTDPDEKVRIYRAAPRDVHSINPGDWVTQHADYAHQHAVQDDNSENDWPVMTEEVPAKHLHTDLNDDNEWGYNGPSLHETDVHHEEHGIIPRHVQDEMDEEHQQGQDSRREHRGGAIVLPKADHDFVHDSSRPVHERAQRLLGHLDKYDDGEVVRAGHGASDEVPDMAQFDAEEKADELHHPDRPATQYVLHEHPDGGRPKGISWMSHEHAKSDPDDPTIYEDEFTHHEFGGQRHASLHQVLASLDKEGLWHFTASWNDVRDKAKRLRAEGHVRITVASADGIGGEVKGDHNIYETVLSFVPGSQKVAYWTCGCRWAAFAWGRSPAHKRFEGRQCSHALAMQFEAQSRGMFGRTVQPDAKRPKWLKQRTPVVIQNDRDSNENLTRRAVPPGNMRRTFGSLGSFEAFMATASDPSNPYNIPEGKKTFFSKNPQPAAPDPLEIQRVFDKARDAEYEKHQDDSKYAVNYEPLKKSDVPEAHHAGWKFRHNADADFIGSVFHDPDVPGMATNPHQAPVPTTAYRHVSSMEPLHLDEHGNAWTRHFGPQEETPPEGKRLPSFQHWSGPHKASEVLANHKNFSQYDDGNGGYRWRWMAHNDRMKMNGIAPEDSDQDNTLKRNRALTQSGWNVISSITAQEFAEGVVDEYRRLMDERPPVYVTGVHGSGPMPNPYHDHNEWYHGTTRDIDELNPHQMGHSPASPGSSGPQTNKLLGVHFSALHQVAHDHFARSGYRPNRVFHAELHMSNPIHFEDEGHLVQHVFRWGAENHPDFHDEKHNDNQRWNGSPDSETLLKRDQEYPRDSDNWKHYVRHGMERYLQFHPKQGEIAKAYVDHLHDSGHDGITYGNDVEGPKLHYSAIATHPDQIRVTHVDKMPPTLEFPGDGQVDHGHIAKDHDEDEQLLQDVEDYHTGGQGRFGAEGQQGRGEHTYAASLSPAPDIAIEAQRPPILDAAVDALSRGADPIGVMRMLASVGLEHERAKAILKAAIAETPEEDENDWQFGLAREAAQHEWFHGTRHTHQAGDILEGGKARANQGYGEPADHVYYSGRRDVASYFAEAGYGPNHDLDAKPRVYKVEPVHGHEPDPDEDEEFESFRAPRVRVVGEVPFDHEGFHALHEGSKTAATRFVRCPSCGGRVAADMGPGHVCPHCGNPLGEVDLPELHEASLHRAITSPHHEDHEVYLRFGDWPEDERSRNNVTGFREDGVSAYDLDHHGEPKDPDPHFSRGHEHDEYCDEDCDLDSDNSDYGNDTLGEMNGRVHRAEQGRRQGHDRPSDRAHLVKGTMVGVGHDGEPLLQNVRRVGDWIDHKHLFFPGADPHHLARHPDEEDYEPPEEHPTHHTSAARTAMPSRKHTPPADLYFDTYDAPVGSEHYDEAEESHPGWSHHLLRAHRSELEEDRGHPFGMTGMIYYSRTPEGAEHPGVAIHDMRTYPGHGGQGIGSAMQDELRRMHPHHMIDHGSRTDDGAGWHSQYQDPGDPRLDLSHPDNAGTENRYRPTELAEYLMTKDLRGRRGAKKSEVDGPSVAGLVLKAADTGRILMLQRALEDESDPAAGTWEFPGGHLEPGDHTSLHGAIREWQEEVGQPLPEGGVVHHTWTSPNGVYQGHVVVIPEERGVALHEGRVTTNPDDPDGEQAEQAAWWDPDHAKKNPALRPECKDSPWKEIKAAGNQKTAVVHEAEDYATYRKRMDEQNRLRDEHLKANPPKPVVHKPEVVDEGPHSIHDVSRHFGWEGFDAHEIAHMVHNPERAQFTLEDVPVDSLRHWGPKRSRKIPTYDQIVGDDDDERERMEGLEHGYSEGHDVPPIVVVRHGDKHLIADGSHRAAIHARSGETHIRAFVTPRTRFPGKEAASEHDDELRGVFDDIDWHAPGGDPLDDSLEYDAPGSASVRQLPTSSIGPLYHGTTADRADHILAHGFHGHEDRKGAIFLTPHPHLAQQYAASRAEQDGGHPAVLKVDQVHGVSAHEVGGFLNPDFAREAGAHYMDKGPEVLVLHPDAIHGISRHARAKQAASWDALEEFDPGTTPPPHSTSENPASTGFATSQDPSEWDGLGTAQSLTPSGYIGSYQHATLHEEPEGALPFTDGADDDLVPVVDAHSHIPSADTDGGEPGMWGLPDPRADMRSSIPDVDNSATPNQFHASAGGEGVADIVAQFQATAAARSLGTSVAGSGAPGDASNSDIASAAKAFLSKESLKSFNYAEQQELINEGAKENLMARNADVLQIDGTHYSALEEALSAEEALKDSDDLFA